MIHEAHNHEAHNGINALIVATAEDSAIKAHSVVFVYSKNPQLYGELVTSHGVFRDYETAMRYLESLPEYEKIDWDYIKGLSYNERYELVMSGVFVIPPEKAIYHSDHRVFVFIEPFSLDVPHIVEIGQYSNDY